MFEPNSFGNYAAAFTKKQTKKTNWNLKLQLFRVYSIWNIFILEKNLTSDCVILVLTKYKTEIHTKIGTSIYICKLGATISAYSRFSKHNVYIYIYRYERCVFI